MLRVRIEKVGFRERMLSGLVFFAAIPWILLVPFSLLLKIIVRLSKDPADYKGICAAWADNRPCSLSEWLWWDEGMGLLLVHGAVVAVLLSVIVLLLSLFPVRLPIVKWGQHVQDRSKRRIGAFVAVVYVAWVMVNCMLIVGVESCILSRVYLMGVSYGALVVIGAFVFGAALKLNVSIPLRVLCGLAWILGGSFAFAYLPMQDKGASCSLTVNDGIGDVISSEPPAILKFLRGD